MVSELAGAPSRPELCTPWPAAVLLFLNSNFCSFVQEQWPDSSRLSRNSPSNVNDTFPERKTFSKKELLICVTLLFLCSSQFVFPRIKELCGHTIPDLGLWTVPILNPILAPWVEFPFGQSCGHSWRQQNCHEDL